MQKTIYKRTSLITAGRWLLIVLLSGLPMFAESKAGFRWTVGEECQYQVRYAFLKIANLNLAVVKKDTLRGHPVYQVEMSLKSTRRLPFVKIDNRFVSYVDQDLYTHAFLAWEKSGDETLYTRYDFDYDCRQLLIHTERHTANDTIVTLDSVATLTEKMQDGLSILFYARAFANRDSANTLPVFAYNDRKETRIDFSGVTESLKTRDGRMPSHLLSGCMSFVGVGGLREDFQGWFSTDAQRVLLEARLKAVVGSVRLKLESWRNWRRLEPADDTERLPAIPTHLPPAA